MSEAYATVEYRGDWKWHRESFGMKMGYNATAVCHMCTATTRAGDSQNFG